MKDKIIKSVVFDLDGTLMSSGSTIYKCTLRTFKEFNMIVDMPEAEFNNKIGYHFKDIFSEFGIDVPDLEGFIDKYKALYFDFIDDSIIYPNVIETLERLNEMKIPVSLLTTKAQDQSEKILEHFNLSRYFNVIVGRRPGIAIKPAPDTLFQICSFTGIEPEDTLMVGDTELDIKCGKNAGALTCAVTYGYRKEEDLLKEEPDFIISDMTNLLDIVK